MSECVSLVSLVKITPSSCGAVASGMQDRYPQLSAAPGAVGAVRVYAGEAPGKDGWRGYRVLSVD